MSALLSKAQFCRETSISPASLNRYMAAGKVAYTRLGTRVLIPSSELDRLAALACSFGADAPVVLPVEGRV